LCRRHAVAFHGERCGPHLHEPALGLQTAMGQVMARYVGTGDQSALPLPMSPIRTLPFHVLRRADASAVIAWYRLTDGGVRA
jgi:hypothetical protein